MGFGKFFGKSLCDELWSVGNHDFLKLIFWIEVFWRKMRDFFEVPKMVGLWKIGQFFSIFLF
jgi:hypothetical protein